jgi:hypothetical protein
MIWTGRVISAIVAALLLMGGVINVTRPDFAVEQSAKYGYSESSLPILGIVTIVSVILYVIPRTAVLGAILLTGYFGGAVATHVTHSEPFILALVVGVLVWGGLYLRYPSIRALIPLRKGA